MAEKTTYHGVYIADADTKPGTEPLALFKHADAAQQWRKQHYGDQGLVAPASIAVAANSDVADLQATPEEPVAASVGEDLLRAQIRSELVAERTKERIRREIEAELDQEDGKATELREPALLGIGIPATPFDVAPTPPKEPEGTSDKPAEASKPAEPKPAAPKATGKA